MFFVSLYTFSLPAGFRRVNQAILGLHVTISELYNKSESRSVMKVIHSGSLQVIPGSFAGASKGFRVDFDFFQPCRDQSVTSINLILFMIPIVFF